MRDVRTVAILGAGDMGHGIAELFAIHGFEVRLRDVAPDALERATSAIDASLDRLVRKGRLSEEAARAARASIRPTEDLREAVEEADLVVEAVPERLDLKQRVLAEAEAHAPPHAVLASNTSAMRIREIAQDLREPGRLVGMHFFNPVLLMDLIEVVPSPASHPEAVATVEAVAGRVGKTVVTLSKDTPGFVTSRLMATWMGAAMLAVEHKLGDKESIDASLRSRAGFPMGPFELADFTGIDVAVHAGDYLADRLGEAYRPSPLLRDLAAKGLLGKKAGRGFYGWEGARPSAAATAEMGGAFDPALVLAVVANEAAKLLEQGVATAAQIDLAMRKACAFPKGPLEWADEAGLDAVLKTLYTLEERTGHPLTRPYELLVELVEDGHLGRRTGRGFLDHAAAAATSTVPQPLAAASVPAQRPGPGAGASPFETLLVEVDAPAGVGTLRLNRPHRLHALDAKAFQELRAALAQMEADAQVRVIVLTATGEMAFSTGTDAADVARLPPMELAFLARQGHLLCLEMEKAVKPIVAAVNGLALGGGFELTLAADVRVASRRAVFGLPETTLGLLPAMGGTQRLVRLVGLARAKEIALFGDRFDADAAHRWGLVARVFADDSFEADAHAYAAALATRAPPSLAFTKQLLNAAPTTDLLAGMEAEAAALGLLAGARLQGE